MASPKETECPHCNKDYTTPKFLPCAHVICRHCLLSLGKKSCPVCHVDILSAENIENCDFNVVVDDLPHDYGMVAVLQSQKILQTPHVCNDCDDVTAATSFCFECSQKLCAMCRKRHAKSPASKHHLIHDLSELTVERLAENSHVTCQQHGDWPVEWYCPAHQEVMCTQCMAEHGWCGEKKVKVSKVVDGERQKLKEQGSRLLNLGTVLKNKVNDVEQQVQQGRQQFISASLTLRQQFLELQQALDTQRQRLLHHLHTQQQDYLTSASSELAPLQELTPVVTAHGHAADRLATRTAPAHLMTLMPRLRPRLDELESRSAEWDPRHTHMRACSDESDHRERDAALGANTSGDVDGSGDGHVQSQDCAETSTPRTVPVSPTGADGTNTRTSPGLSSHHVFNGGATTKRNHMAGNFALDATLIDMVKHAIASLDFELGIHSDGSMRTSPPSCLTDPRSEMTRQRGQNPPQDGMAAPEAGSITCSGATTTECYACAEDGTVSEDKPNKSVSPAVKKFLPLDIVDESTTSTQAASAQLMSCSFPSLQTTDDPSAVQDYVHVTLDDIVTVSSDRTAKRSRLSAMSRFIASLVTQHLDCEEKSKQGTDAEDEKVKTDISEKDNPSGNSSPTKTQTEDSSGSTLRNSENSSHPHNEEASARPQTLGLPESQPACSNPGGEMTTRAVAAPGTQRSSSKCRRKIQAAGRMEFSYEEARDNWANDALEAEASRRQRSKSSSDVPSAYSDFYGTEIPTDSIDKSALVNTGFTALSTPTSHAVHVLDVGSRVMRGPDWSAFMDDVDGGEGGMGRVLTKGSGLHMRSKGWVLVHWNATRLRKWHRMGAEGCFDLTLC